jgi:hypothetical protein
MLFSLALATLSSTPALAAPVKITSASSSSNYDSGGVSYPATKVKDKQRKPWYEGDRGNGLGSWVMVEFEGDKAVTRVVMLPGDWTSADSWSKANRPKEVELKFADESTETWTLDDEMVPQTFKLPKTTTTNSIRFRVTQIYSGTAFPDTAISEIRVFDDQPGEHAAKELKASTEFPTDADSSYVAVMANDGVRDTSWCEGNKTNDGTGEWLEVHFQGAKKVSKMNICTGVCQMLGTLHKDTNAPSNVTVSFSDGSSQKVTLADKAMPQSIPLTPRTVEWARVTINGVRKGKQFDDACISELAFQ